MKILCLETPKTCRHTFQGWANILKKNGHEFNFCNINKKPVFDAFDECDPDLFIGTVTDITRGVATCLTEFKIPAILYSPPYLSLEEIDIECVQQLRKDCGQPELIFNFADNKSLNQSLGGWSKEGFKIKNILRAADTTLFNYTKPKPEFEADVAYVGNFTPHVIPYIFPLCHNTPYSVRIFGTGSWPIVNYLGQVDRKNVHEIYASSKISLSISPPNDIEPDGEVFNIIASGGFCLANNFPEDILKIEKFSNKEELQNLVDQYTASPAKNQLRQQVLENHTYAHRLQHLLKVLGFSDEVISI
jgi:hypothetical protein